jgi:hypothetical protein
MNAGLKTLKGIQYRCLEQHKGFWLVIEHIIGQIYLEMITGPKPGIGIMVRNLGFLIKNVPFAARKAERHLKKAIETARELGATGTMGQAYFDLGRFYKAKKKKRQAKECTSKAVEIFAQSGADGYIRRALKALESLR